LIRQSTKAVLLSAVLASLFSLPAFADEPTWFGAKQTAAIHDPRAVACIELGVRGEGPDSGSQKNMYGSAVEMAAATLNIAALEDAFAKCRLAFRAFPSEPKVVVAHYATESSVAIILFGLKNPPTTDEAALDDAIKSLAAASADTFGRRLANFFIGSDYEFGVGTTPDLAKASAAYRSAAEAGDTIAPRELARLASADSGGTTAPSGEDATLEQRLLVELDKAMAGPNAPNIDSSNISKYRDCIVAVFDSLPITARRAFLAGSDIRTNYPVFEKAYPDIARQLDEADRSCLSGLKH
jgi:hypothetical protein